MEQDNTIYVGIDQSITSTGLVILVDGMVSAKAIRTEKDQGGTMEKLRRIRSICAGVIESIDHAQNSNPLYQVDIRIEGLGYGSAGDATRDLAGLQYLILDRLVSAGYTNVTIIPPTTLKKFATGKGNCGKVEMLDSLPDLVKENFVAKFKKSGKKRGLWDVADAYWLAKYQSPE